MIKYVKKFFAYADLKVALKMGIAASLSLLFEEGFTKIVNRPQALINELWSVMAALVVLQTYLGGTYQAAWKRFLGVFIGSLIGATFLLFFNKETLNVGLGVFFTVIICALTNLKENYRIASVSTAFIIIAASVNTEVNPWLFSFYRFLDSCVGIVAALVTAYFIWPETATRNLRDNVCKILTSLGRYYYFAVNLEPESPNESKMAQSLAEELIEFFEKNQSYKQEAIVELRYHEELFPNWSLMTTQTEDLFKSISFLRNVPKTTLIKIFDDSLTQAISRIISETELAFKSIETQLSTNIPVVISEELSLSIENLNKELLRFRETHTVRKFSLQDVEDYYVFFYNLRYIAEAIVKL